MDRFGVFCNSDGSFRVADVPAGTYELEIKVRDLKLNSVSPHDVSDNRAVDAALVVREVTVSEIPHGQADEPLDLGTLELVASKATTRVD